MSAGFKDTKAKRPLLRYVEFTFRDESDWLFHDEFTVGYADVPVRVITH